MGKKGVNCSRRNARTCRGRRKATRAVTSSHFTRGVLLLSDGASSIQSFVLLLFYASDFGSYIARRELLPHRWFQRHQPHIVRRAADRRFPSTWHIAHADRCAKVMAVGPRAEITNNLAISQDGFVVIQKQLWICQFKPEKCCFLVLHLVLQHRIASNECTFWVLTVN